MKKNRTYIAIDLKSFYASVECAERGLDPLNTNLVVADQTRTDKTICLAVSPSLKSFGVPSRPRLFEVIQKVKEVNQERLNKAGYKAFRAMSYDYREIDKDPAVGIEYLIAPPRMAFYIQYSTKIYNVYLKYIAPEDIHVYSIDEVFMDVTDYLNTYNMTAHELAMTMIRDVLNQTGITATAGIGTNLYLCKVAMDIVAKHIPADKDGVRIAELDEMSYREKLWNHMPLTDFWRIGRGYQNRLEKYDLHTMGDVARFSLEHEDLLYEEFGINAELLIDHAWGYESCTMKDIKAYKPQNNSLSSGQVLSKGYTKDQARIVVKEMIDNLVLDMVDKGLVCNQFSLGIHYDNACLNSNYHGEVTLDYYGRSTPKPAHGGVRLEEYTSSTKEVIEKLIQVYDQIVDKNLLVRRIFVVAGHVLHEDQLDTRPKMEQLDLFSNYEEKDKQAKKKKEEDKRERKAQKAILEIKQKYGKNAVLKGMNAQEGATAKERNEQIGGHRS